MKVWKDCTTEDTSIIIEKAMKTINPQTTNYYWRKLCPDAVHDFRRFMMEPLKNIMKESMDMEKEKGGLVKSFKIQSWRNSRAN